MTVGFRKGLLMEKLTSPYQDRLEFIKNPVIAEFLGMPEDTSYLESDLEQCIIDNLQKFLMELGKGYAFVARQQHIHTEKEDYYIDLVFYNYILKCFVLIDLKTQKITHQDVEQMDMYVRMYDEMKKQPDDNPTLGIVLCADTDEDIAKYSVLHGSEQLFATKYKLYLPSEEELKAEIQTQKELFELKNFIIYKGQKFEADAAYIDIYQQAKKSIYVVDDYMNTKSLQLLSQKKPGVEVILFTENGHGKRGFLATSVVNDFINQYPSLKIKPNPDCHDRLIVLDYGLPTEQVYHCGASSKDAGRKLCAINKVESVQLIRPVIDALLKLPDKSI